MMVNLHEWELTERAKKQGWEEGKIEGQKEGAEQKAIETAKNALKNNIPVEMVVKITGLTENKVLELKKEIGQ